MSRAYYYSSIKEFLEMDEKTLSDKIVGGQGNDFNAEEQQKNAWDGEITILKDQLVDFPDGDIIFEYTIPRVGTRIDVVCLIKGIVFLLEFKVRDTEKEYQNSTKKQVLYYAVDMKDCHEMSRDRYIVPVAVETEARKVEISIVEDQDRIFEVVCCNKKNIKTVIDAVLEKYSDEPIDVEAWVNSVYKPTPTVIEVAQRAYRNHTVEDITRKESDKMSFADTVAAINKIIEQCKEKNEKAICFVTGVPGAGKTLVGLQLACERHNFDEDEHAVFLSGNGPLVDVLHKALEKDVAVKIEKEKKKLKKDDAAKLSVEKEREKNAIRKFISNIHKYRDMALESSDAPAERIAIFDEAQRAWDEPKLTEFMKDKKKTPNFNKTEPEFLISVLDRHQDWATIVCLVGGGQEINKGEVGIKQWFAALNSQFSNWKIYLADKLSDAEYIGDSDLDQLLNHREYTTVRELHLSTSERSFRSANLADFVKALLDHNTKEAQEQYQQLLKNKYPLKMTRDLEKAKQWLKEQSGSVRRCGILASSEGKRLRAQGLWIFSKIEHVQWFLEDKDHVNSSSHLEVVATEFQVQGLEIDYALLAWDADMRIETNEDSKEEFGYYQYRRTWGKVGVERKKMYMKNAYRVLLTRARQGLIIYIPEGNDEDKTIRKELYDGTYNYFKEIGIEEI